MVKTKKISKQSIVIIALSLLLVLSMIMSLSGAWFSDTSDDNAVETIGFGTVVVGDVVADSIVLKPDDPSEQAFPGDTVEVAFTVINAGTGKVWMRYQLDFDVSGFSLEVQAELAPALAAYDEYVYWATALEASASAHDISGSDVTLPTTLTNAFQGEELPMTLTVEFIQWANLNDYTAETESGHEGEYKLGEDYYSSICELAFAAAGYADGPVPTLVP